MAEQRSPLEEYQKQRDEAFEILKASLDNRKNQAFEPNLLAMAQGFLAPTKTGGFGESLSTAAANVGQVQKQEQEDLQKNAKMRYELAVAQAEAGRKMAAVKALQSMAPEGGNTISLGGQSFPASFAGLTPEKAMMIAQLDPEQGKLAMDYLKLKESLVKTQPGGVVTVTPGQGKGFEYTPFGGKTLTKRFIPGVGSLEMTEDDAIQLDNARVAQRENPSDPRAQQTINAIIGSYRGVPSGAPTARGPMTPAEEAAQAEAAKIKATEAAKAETGRTQANIGRAEDVTSRLGTYNILESLAKKPDANKVFGILANNDVRSAIGKLVETGIGVRGFTIGIPEIQNVLRNLNLPEAQISDAQLAASLVAEAQLQTARLGQGQGSVSNFERSLFGQAALTMDDRPETIIRKVNMLRARAELESEIAKTLRRTKMDIDDFRDTPEYAKLVADYDQKLYNVANATAWRVKR